MLGMSALLASFGRRRKSRNTLDQGVSPTLGNCKKRRHLMALGHRVNFIAHDFGELACRKPRTGQRIVETDRKYAADRSSRGILPRILEKAACRDHGDMVIVVVTTALQGLEHAGALQFHREIERFEAEVHEKHQPRLG